jgi:hypothetical protein
MNCEHINLETIYSDPRSYGETNVVRWCSDCGAVVVDLDYDGRTKPGGIMKMRFVTK